MGRRLHDTQESEEVRFLLSALAGKDNMALRPIGEAAGS